MRRAFPLLKAFKLNRVLLAQTIQITKNELYIEQAYKLTFTKILLVGFAWSPFSEDCKKPDSSTQLEAVMSELRGYSLPAVLVKVEVA